MTRSSCITYTPSSAMVIIRAELLAICQQIPIPATEKLFDPCCAAAVLNNFIFWTDIKLAGNEQKQIENELRATADKPLLEISLWIWKSNRDLCNELLNTWGESKVGVARKYLVAAGYLEQRRNPTYQWDRTYQFRLNITKVQSLIQDLHSLKLSHQQLKNAEAIPQTTNIEVKDSACAGTLQDEYGITKFNCRACRYYQVGAQVNNWNTCKLGGYIIVSDEACSKWEKSEALPVTDTAKPSASWLQSALLEVQQIDPTNRRVWIAADECAGCGKARVNQEYQKVYVEESSHLCQHCFFGQEESDNPKGEDCRFWQDNSSQCGIYAADKQSCPCGTWEERPDETLAAIDQALAAVGVVPIRERVKVTVTELTTRRAEEYQGDLSITLNGNPPTPPEQMTDLEDTNQAQLSVNTGMVSSDPLSPMLRLATNSALPEWCTKRVVSILAQVYNEGRYAPSPHITGDKMTVFKLISHGYLADTGNPLQPRYTITDSGRAFCEAQPKVATAIEDYKVASAKPKAQPKPPRKAKVKNDFPTEISEPNVQAIAEALAQACYRGTFASCEPATRKRIGAVAWQYHYTGHTAETVNMVKRFFDGQEKPWTNCQPEAYLKHIDSAKAWRNGNRSAVIPEVGGASGIVIYGQEVGEPKEGEL